MKVHIARDGMVLGEWTQTELYPLLRAYAWTYRDGAQNKTVAVLEIPPVDSPQNAVKVAVAAKGRQSK